MRKINGTYDRPAFFFFFFSFSGNALARIKCKSAKTCYLFLVILGDVAEKLTGLPEQDILLAKLFLQELLQHKSYTSLLVRSLRCCKSFN